MAPPPEAGRSDSVKEALSRTKSVLAEEQKLRRNVQAELVGMDSKLSSVMVRLPFGGTHSPTGPHHHPACWLCNGSASAYCRSGLSSFRRSPGAPRRCPGWLLSVASLTS